MLKTTVKRTNFSYFMQHFGIKKQSWVVLIFMFSKHIIFTFIFVKNVICNLHFK